jgi:hypothetical protein
VVLAIWKVRNDLIFNLKVPIIDEVFYGITMHSWKWLCERRRVLFGLSMNGLCVLWIVFLDS